MISIEHVTVEYEKGIKALDDFSLMIKPGELIVLGGKSAGGKPTAPRLINGLIPHFYQAEMFGKVVINDDDTKDMEISEIAEHVGSGVKIKAAGGISSLEDAERFLELGADRLGTSRIVRLVREKGADGK